VRDVELNECGRGFTEIRSESQGMTNLTSVGENFLKREMIVVPASTTLLRSPSMGS